MSLNKCKHCGEALGVEAHVCKKQPSTYRYRDPARHREYMKKYMREYRARKGKGELG